MAGAVHAWASSAAMRRSGSSASARPALDVGRPPGELVVLVVGSHDGAGGQPRQADQQHDLARAAPRAPRRSGAPAAPTTPPRARGSCVSAGFSSTSTAPPAPSAQRPAHEASQAARRPASQRPSAAERTTHSTARLCAALLGDEAQRPARGLQLEREASVGGLVAGQARREPVVARGAPRGAARRAPCRRRAVVLGCGLERVGAPGDLDLIRIPGTTSQQAGGDRHMLKPYEGSAARRLTPPWHGGSSTGGGATRTSSPRTTRCGRAAAFLAEQLGFGSAEPEHPVPLAELSLPAPRLSPPAVAGRRSARPTTYERALHSYGRSYRDVVRAFRGPVRPPARRGRAAARRGRGRTRCSSGRPMPARR